MRFSFIAGEAVQTMPPPLNSLLALCCLAIQSFSIFHQGFFSGSIFT